MLEVIPNYESCKTITIKEVNPEFVKNKIIIFKTPYGIFKLAKIPYSLDSYMWCSLEDTTESWNGVDDFKSILNSDYISNKKYKIFIFDSFKEFIEWFNKEGNK